MASGLGLEETELRLGLPGGGGGGGGGGEAEAVKCSGKRGFEQTLDLKLQLHTPVVTKKDEAQAAAAEEEEAEHPVPCADPEKPPAPKAQVVGWPPVRSFRRNMISTRSEKSKEGGGGNKSGSKSSNYAAAAAATASFVKVSMDGAPYLRKVDLKTYRSYGDLSVALQNLFRSFTTGNNFTNENKVINLINGSEYVATYEDKDGDWMLVGDVPWEMFADSCKRLRIMKGSEARGLAPTKRDGEVQE